MMDLILDFGGVLFEAHISELTAGIICLGYLGTLLAASLVGWYAFVGRRS